MAGLTQSPNCVAAARGGELSIMADPTCRHGLFRVAQMPMRTLGRCLRGAAILGVAASLSDVAHAQFQQLEVDPPLPLQRSSGRPGTPTPTYPLVKPGLPPTSQAPQLPLVEQLAPVSVRVQQSKTHPSGVTILVDTVRFLPSSIVVDVEIFNPGVNRRRLNPSGSLLLTDDRGQSYLFLPPPDNPEMQIAPRSHVFGRLVFLGVVDWQARALRLSINHPLGSPTDRMTVTPLFQFSLPAEPRS